MVYKKNIDTYNNFRSYNSNKNIMTKQITLKDVLSFPIKGNPDRQLTDEAAKYFGIRQEYSEEDGKTIVATYFPSYNQNNNIIGFKRRDWTIDKEERGHFTAIGVVKTKNQMFGQPQTAAGRNNKTLVQFEAEEDTYCGWQAWLDNLRNQVKDNPSKKESLKTYLDQIEYSISKISEGDLEAENLVTIPVVGLGNGAPNASESIAHNEKFVKRYGKYVIATDNDHLTEEERIKYGNTAARGDEAAASIASYLLTNNLYRLKYPHESNDPDGYKDARDFLIHGEGKLLAELMMYCDNKYIAEKIINPSGISIKDLRKKKKQGVPLKYMPAMNNMMLTPITGELWTLTGPSGSGKSTLGRLIEKDIIDYLRNGLSEPVTEDGHNNIDSEGKYRLDGYVEGERCGIIRLEEDEEETLNSLYALDLGIDPKAFCADPEEFLTEEQHTAIHQKWIDEDRVEILDHFGSMPIDQLISKLKQMVFLYNCRWIILDHLSMLISGLRTGDERKELDIIMTELAAFCKQYDVYILAIAHMKRKTFDPPKDKETQENLPFFYPVRKEDLRGSAALEQLSWVVLGVEPEELPNRSRGRVRIVSLKNRRGKKLGYADTLWMQNDGTFVAAGDWEVKDGCYYKDGEVMHCYIEEPPEVVRPPLKELEIEVDKDSLLSSIMSGSADDEEDKDPPF